MNLNSVLFMLLGAALVAVGVLAAALADRIRGQLPVREAAPRERASRTPSPQPTKSPATQHAVIPVVELPRAPVVPPAKPQRRVEPKQPSADGADDVIAALVASGFKKPIATEATWACSVAERATVEDWMAAALRRCARGAMS
jgi:hypothetical protein